MLLVKAFDQQLLGLFAHLLSQNKEVNEEYLHQENGDAKVVQEAVALLAVDDAAWRQDERDQVECHDFNAMELEEPATDDQVGFAIDLFDFWFPLKNALFGGLLELFFLQ